MKYKKPNNKNNITIVVYTLQNIHYNSENKKYYFVTDINNNTLYSICLSSFRLICGFNEKSYLRGCKNYGFNNFAYTGNKDIDAYIYDYVSKINQLNNGIKTNNNYTALKNCSVNYPKGTNLYKSGLFQKLKSQFTIKKQVIKI